MPRTWITDLQHFLEDDRLAPQLLASARKRAEYLGAIVVAVTSDEDAMAPRSGVQCRARPKRKRCPGEIEAMLDPLDDAIRWHCPACDEEGVISGWEGTLWDCRERLNSQ